VAHSAGLTGATYASGTRGMPGGSAFTLTGVFVDRITPRLMAVGAAARAQAAHINAMGTKLGRMNAYMERNNASLDRSRAKLRALANQRMMLTRVYAAQNKEIAVGARLANQSEKDEMRRFGRRRTALEREYVTLQKTNAALARNRALLAGGAAGTYRGRRLPTSLEVSALKGDAVRVATSGALVTSLAAKQSSMQREAAMLQEVGPGGAPSKELLAATTVHKANLATQKATEASLAKQGVLLDKNAQKEFRAATAARLKLAAKEAEIKHHQRAMAQNALSRRLLNSEEIKYLAALQMENVQLDGQTKEQLKALGITEAQLEKITQKLALEAIETKILQDMNLQQQQRLFTEQKLTAVLAEQFALYGGMRTMVFGGAKLGAGLGIAAGAISGISAIVAGGTMKDFEQSLARIGAIGQFSQQEKWGLGKYTTGLSQQYALSPEQMLGGSLVGVKAGYRDIAELQGMLVPSMQLAIVNGEELDNVMEQLIMTMNAFHIETSQANSVIANQQALINNSLLQFGDYTDGMKYAAAWANKLGLSYQEVGSMIATMTDAGVRAGISGRSLRRMYSKFAADMDVIAEKLAKGGSELEVFTEDGVLNIRELIDFLGNGVDNVEDMQFALERFGLRGAQSFLLLAQNMDKYDHLLGIQTGNTEELAKMAEEAQNTISGQWQLLKNMLREPLLSQELINQMKDLMIYMREEGGMKDLANVFADIVRSSIAWLKSGAFKDMVDLLRNLAKIFRDMQPTLLFFTNIMMKIGKLWYVVLPLARMMKANTMLNMLAKSMMIFYAAQRGGYGRFSGGMGGMLGIPNLPARGAGGAAAANAALNGRGLTTGAVVGSSALRTGVAGAGMGAVGGLALGAGIGIGALALYLLWKKGQDEEAANMRDLVTNASQGATNEFNFYGDTYGGDEIEAKMNSVSTDLFSYQERKL